MELWIKPEHNDVDFIAEDYVSDHVFNEVSFYIVLPEINTVEVEYLLYDAPNETFKFLFKYLDVVVFSGLVVFTLGTVYHVLILVISAITRHKSLEKDLLILHQ